MPQTGHRTVIVGASIAGLGVAENLRALGYEGEVVVLDRDKDQPCDRPPLTKAFLLGTQEDLTLPFALFAKDADVEVLLGQDIVSVDTSARTVTSATGQNWSYSDLVIATGSSARRLPVPASHGVDIHVVRDRADAVRLREAARQGGSALVVGAGFLGLETASSLTQLGMEVRVITNVDTPLLPTFGAEVAAFETELMRQAEVGFTPGTSVREYAISGDGQICAELTDGTVVAVDLVVEAVGAAPSTEWLRGSGLQLEDGVPCDATLSAAEGIYAAGDVCRWFNPRYGRSMRIEHWTNALDQAATVAGNIVSEAPTEYRGIPYFWSDHFGAHLQFAGTTEGVVETVCATRAPTSLVVRYLDSAGEEIGILTFNEPRPIIEHRRRA